MMKNSTNFFDPINEKHSIASVNMVFVLNDPEIDIDQLCESVLMHQSTLTVQSKRDRIEVSAIPGKEPVTKRTPAGSILHNSDSTIELHMLSDNEQTILIYRHKAYSTWDLFVGEFKQVEQCLSIILDRSSVRLVPFRLSVSSKPGYHFTVSPATLKVTLRFPS